MRTFARPVIVVSRCLGFEACRYNGQVLPNRFLEALAEHAEVKTVCPEVEIGLGTPRDPIRIVKDGERMLLEQPSTGLDLTSKMEAYTRERLSGLGSVDGFVLKSRSPSCGLTDTKIHSPKANSPSLGRGAGLFGARVLERFPEIAVEDEGRLTNFRIREHFLTRIYTWAAFREVRKARRMGKLVEFQARNKLLFMALSQKEMKAMGKVVANPERRRIDEVLDAYQPHLAAAFSRVARYTSHINVLMHALGYSKEELTSKEKAHFLDLLERYRSGRIPLSAITSVLRSWVARFGQEYLDSQTWFEPFPEDLIEITDSGKGRGK